MTKESEVTVSDRDQEVFALAWNEAYKTNGGNQREADKAGIAAVIAARVPDAAMLAGHFQTHRICKYVERRGYNSCRDAVLRGPG